MSRACGCNEYRRLSRRTFLQNSGIGLAALVGAPAWLPRVAYAQEGTSGRDVIVSIFLRGGSDGLTLCVPHGDPAYYRARPALAVPRPDSGRPDAARDLDGFFGLPPGLAPLLPAYQAGHLLPIHACGLVDETRSHFDAQRYMEVGKPRDNRLATGWLARHLMTTAPVQAHAPLRAMALSDALPQTLLGAPHALAVPQPSDYAGGNGDFDDAFATLLELYARTDEPLRTAAENTQRTLDLLEAIDFTGYGPGGDAAYPDDPFAMALRATAALLRADAGVEAIAIDVGGWDTHENQGNDEGTLAELMSLLGRGLGAFHADIIGEAGLAVTVVVLSEFGRTIEVNGSAGTDHGHGNAMFLLGGSVRGGRVLADWPGLAREQWYQDQDLAITIDYRDILAEVLAQRAGGSDLATVFPGYTPTFRGVV